MASTQDTTTETPLTPRQTKALNLINAGKVHLLPGHPFGFVDGSKGEKYQVSRSHCTCPDWTHRQPEGGCGHQLALRAVCVLYRLARTEARATGRARLPWMVGLALRPFPRSAAA